MNDRHVQVVYFRDLILRKWIISQFSSYVAATEKITHVYSLTDIVSCGFVVMTNYVYYTIWTPYGILFS